MKIGTLKPVTNNCTVIWRIAIFFLSSTVQIQVEEKEDDTEESSGKWGWTQQG